LVLEAMWTGPARRDGAQRRQEVGGRFVSLSTALRQRIGAILTFDDARPAFRLVRIDAAAARRDRRPRALTAPRAGRSQRAPGPRKSRP
jgi:hypothetical protein